MHMTRLLAGTLTACVLTTSPLAAQTYETVTVHNTAGWPNVEPQWFAFQKGATIRYNMSPGNNWSSSAPRIEITQPTVINRIAGAMVASSNPGNNFANIEFKIHVHSNEQDFADHAQSGDVFNRSGGYVANLGKDNLPPALGVVDHINHPVHWVEIGFEPFLLQPGSYVFNVQGYVYGHSIAWTQTGLNFDAPADVYTDIYEQGTWLEYGKDDYLAPLNPHAGIVIEGLVEVPDCIPADLNCDGVVNVSDLLMLLAAWGTCAKPDDCPADLNDDGVVNVSDLLILLSNWG
jgi:hypothetical protein